MNDKTVQFHERKKNSKKMMIMIQGYFAKLYIARIRFLLTIKTEEHDG